MSVGRDVGADVTLLQAVAGLLVRLRDVDRPLRDAPEQLTADVTFVAELLVQKSLFVTVPEIINVPLFKKWEKLFTLCVVSSHFLNWSLKDIWDIGMWLRKSPCEPCSYEN